MRKGINQLTIEETHSFSGAGRLLFPLLADTLIRDGNNLIPAEDFELCDEERKLRIKKGEAKVCLSGHGTDTGSEKLMGVKKWNYPSGFRRI